MNFNDEQTSQYAMLLLTNLIQELRSNGIAMDPESDKKTFFFEAANKIEERLVLNRDKFMVCLYNCYLFEQSLSQTEYKAYNGIFKNIHDIESLEKVNEQYFMVIYNDRVESILTQNIGVIINLLNDVIRMVTQNYLNPWKENQRYVLNGAQQMNPIILDIIQGWYESIAKICWNTHEHLKHCVNVRGGIQQNIPNPFIVLYQRVRILLSNLIANSFIIEKQPPQVLKVLTKFQSTVRMLFGNVLSFNPKAELNKVEVLFVNELQAQKINQTNIVGDSSCGLISNNIGYMDYNPSNKMMYASFKNIQLTKRPERTHSDSSAESVMEEKFALCFKSNISINNGELVISVWTISMPVVVIVHGSQELQAWATIFWENSISRFNNGLVSNVNVPWYHLSNALSMKFSSSMGFDGHYLTQQNIDFLQYKAFGGHFSNENDLSITWQQFRKNHMMNQSFSFWEWFYHAMKLTKDHLRDLWYDGCIIGFIDKSTTEACLLKCDQGTFLIRFSDSLLGAISIAWKSSPTTVSHVYPMKSSDLAIRSLADCVMDYSHLTKIYPGTDKLVAFEKYISPPRTVPLGINYVPSNIRVEI
ncbi:unnamed protein product [Diamesa tonsa]